MSSFYETVRDAIYSMIVSTGAAPAAADIAELHGVPIGDVEAAFHALADAHVIVLQPGTHDLAWAPPFSALPTPYKARVAATSWFAPCAWDAFGIPAALNEDAVVDATCAWLAQRGVELLNGPMDRPWGIRTATFQDPAGHIWEIAK